MTSDHVIDAHVHVWTPDLASYPLAAGYSIASMQPASFPPEEFLTTVRPLGVERSVLIQMDFYGCDNSYLLDVLQRFSGVFSGVAQVDERGADLASELRRLKLIGIRGMRVAPPQHGDSTWLDTPGMETLWRCGASEHIAICPLIGAVDLPATARMCQKYPDTTVVVDHCAGIGGDGQFRKADLQALCELAKFAMTYVKLSAFYFLGRKRPPYIELVPMIQRLLDAFGPQRLMWGSDSPFQLAPPNKYQASLELVRHRLDGISSEDRAWLLERTAAKVFFS